MRNIISGILVAAFMSVSAFAATQVSHEQRQKMAELHEKMAACLRSNKPLSECHAEMSRSCQDMMGTQGCPMWGEMGRHMHGQMGGTMGGNMMQHQGMKENPNSGDKK